MKTTLALATVPLGGLAVGATFASAAPMPVNGLHVEQFGITQVRGMRSDRMMKKRMTYRVRVVQSIGIDSRVSPRGWIGHPIKPTETRNAL